MSQIITFNGISTAVPQALSSLTVKQSGALPFAPTGVVGLIGEASKGAPGSVSGILVYDSTTLQDLVNNFGDGPVVDAARALVNASNDGRVPNGASHILVYKTNASTQATLALATNWGTLTSANYGVTENLINVKIDEDTHEVWTLQFGADWTAQPNSNLTLRVNGGTLVTLTGANCDSAANTVVELNSKLNTALGTIGVVYASTVVNRISINLKAANSGAPRAGMGICLEFIASGEYSKIGVQVAQQGVALAAGVTGATSLTASNATRTITLNRQSDNITQDTPSTTGELGGKVYLEIGSNAATSCTLTINATQILTTAVGGGASNLTLNKSDYATLNDLATYINTQAGYSCSIPSGINGGLPPSVLDRVSGVGICASTTSIKPGKVKADAYEVAQWFSFYGTLVTLTSTAFLGFPDTLSKTFLSGAVKGASSTSSFNSGFTAFEAVRINEIIPLVSQDASDDIVESATYTDSSSTYDVESIHVLARDHCRKMSNTLNKSERNCYLGYRETFANVQAQARAINSEFASLLFQDSQVIDTTGTLTYKQPHITACLVAGLQAGAPVGTPATYKFVAANGIKHLKKQGAVPTPTELYQQGVLGYKNQAVIAGVTPLEAPQSGGIRVVVHNTTYSKDASFVFNRVHVLDAANYVAYNLRKALEDNFVGDKAKTGSAETIRNFVIGEMKQFLDDEIIVGDDTNGGLGYKNLTVSINGNVATIDITITPVQGIDFILARITLDNIRQTAQ